MHNTVALFSATGSFAFIWCYTHVRLAKAHVWPLAPPQTPTWLHFWL